MRRSTLSTRSILFTFAVSLAACGGDDEAGDPELSVEDKCNMIADLFCDRSAVCGGDRFGSNEEKQRFIDDCVDRSRSRLQCDSATSVSEDYGECAGAIPTAECTDEQSLDFESPAACESVIVGSS
jgi:hypothetical protein